MLQKLLVQKKFSYGVAYTFFSGLQKGLGFFVFMYLANVLAIREFSKFGVNYSIFTFLGMLTYAGIQESVVSQLNEYESRLSKIDLFKSANAVYLFYCLSLMLIFLILIVPLTIFYQINLLELSYLIAGAILSSFFNFQSTIIRLEEKHFESILISFLPSVIAFTSGLIFVKFSSSGASYFAGVLVGYLISLPIFFFLRNTFNGFHFSTLKIKKIISRVPPYVVIAFWGWLLGYGNAFIIKLLFDDYNVASFIFFYTIASILQLVATSMNQVWSPAFFLNYKLTSIDNLEKRCIKFTTIQGFVLGFVGLFILMTFPLLPQYFPNLNKYSQLSGLLWIFSAYVVSIPWWHAQNYFMINNKGKSLMNLTIVSCIIGYVIWFFCMWSLGSIGIYFGFFIQTLVRSIIVYLKAKENWSLKFDWPGIVIGMFLLLISLVF